MSVWKTSGLSPTELNRAGKTLVTPGATPVVRAEAVATVSEWRSSHAFPLNTLQNWLRGHARAVSKRSVVAQRLKRLESVENKLRRFPTMKLSQIQDFGGCRAIMPSLTDVSAVVKRLKSSTSKHELKNEKNYISSPAPSGYRSYHLIYRYNAAQANFYTRHFIEIQIRTKAQHDWATAVEICGMFLRQDLKSGFGDPEYLEFFRLAGDLFFADEIGVLGGTDQQISQKRRALKDLADSLRIVERIGAFRSSVNWGEKIRIRGKDNVIIVFFIDLSKSFSTIQASRFPRERLNEATELYSSLEKRIADGYPGNAVLVSTEKFTQIRKAYPNYFLDSSSFVSRINRICDG